jgi:hypothetical protein
MMVQFRWPKRSTFEKNYQDKFLLMVHKSNIFLYTASLQPTVADNDFDGMPGSMKLDLTKKGSWYFDVAALKREVIVKSFTWSQWDVAEQSLYYIHVKPSTRNLLLETAVDGQPGNESVATPPPNPTLSAFQFHDDLQTETVLNIPLNLPKLPSASSPSGNDIYEDDTVPLRVHDSSLNLIIVTDETGMLFVCHYYLYQPIQPSASDEPDSGRCISDVHFAYSVTILHHGCVIHCVIPGIPWEKAKMMKPTFTLHGEHHMLVFQADLFMHLLDVGITHEPCCHIVCSPFTRNAAITHLVPCFKNNSISFDSGKWM